MLFINFSNHEICLRSYIFFEIQILFQFCENPYKFKTEYISNEPHFYLEIYFIWKSVSQITCNVWDTHCIGTFSFCLQSPVYKLRTERKLGSPGNCLNCFKPCSSGWLSGDTPSPHITTSVNSFGRLQNGPGMSTGPQRSLHGQDEVQH